jgi:aspartate kinase
MKVFKFGGASINDAQGILNISRILKNFSNEQIFIIVSAMGKTTNALESLLSKAIAKENFQVHFNALKKYHREICKQTFVVDHAIFNTIDNYFELLNQKLIEADRSNYDYHYDQVVSMGEFISTTIVEKWLETQNFNCKWIDARQFVVTDSNYRAAKVDISSTEERIKKLKFGESDICVSQGFIGADSKGHTTTLGREGSDYSAALFAYGLKTNEVVVWKDVEGVFNADPKIFNNTKLIEHLSYKDAIELAFYGASIIHPKTIQPLSEREIILKVKSFYEPHLPGTKITKTPVSINKPTSIIVKKGQLLLSLIPHDLSFMDLSNMSKAMRIVAEHQHHVNLIQNSAVSFSLCLDSNSYHFDELITELKKHFVLRYNKNLILVTIRNYGSQLVERIYESIHLKLEQRNRNTYQVLVDQEEFAANLINLLDG